jgi:hypothetical protein
LKPKTLAKLPRVQAVLVNYACEPLYKGNIFREATKLEALWNKAETTDTLYKGIIKAIQEQKRTFLSLLGIKVSIRECSLDNKGKLLF